MDAVVLAGGKCLRMQDHRFKGLPKILYPLNKDSLIIDEILIRLKVAGIFLARILLLRMNLQVLVVG